jgi:hypothetical protein
MTRCSRALFAVGLLLLTSLALVQSASAQAILAEKYVYGDDSTDGMTFTRMPQEADRWCWAATAQMIMAFHGEAFWRQCIQADDAYPRKSFPRTCCDVGGTDNPVCNRTGWPHFEHYGFQFQQMDESFPWDVLVDQIDKRLPIAVAVKFFTGGGHMGVVVGYQIHEDKTKYVLVVDPDGFHSAVLLRFDELFGVSADGSYKHWRTYYNIKKQ